MPVVFVAFVNCKNNMRDRIHHLIFFEAFFFPIIAIFLTSRSAIFKRFLSLSNKYFEMGGNKDGLVERPFASYLFSLGSIPGPGVTCGLSFVVNSRPCSEGFFSGSNST